MELKLPLIVAPRGGRLVEAWVPGLEGVRAVGAGLAEIRDDLALLVMERFEREAPWRLGTYQFPPHHWLRHVDLDVVAQDPARGRRYKLKGRLGVLVEKWPHMTWYVATPTRLPGARFALRHRDDLDAALRRRVARWCLDEGVESLDAFHAERRERLEILEVDADPPSVLPRPARSAPRRRGVVEAPASREERRRARRANVRALREVGRNLTHLASDGALEGAYGRDRLVDDLVDELDAREGAAVVLVGPPGAGKTAVVHEVVRRLAARHAATGGRRDVWRVDGNRFIAGMMYVGQWEARARLLLEELVDLGDVLYVDDLVSLVYAGRTRHGDTNVASYLEPHLARGEVLVLAESTPERFARVREEAPTFAAHFRVVHVPAMTEREALPVLLGVMRALEDGADGGARVARVWPDALEAALDATRRFNAHEALPGRAVRLLRRAADDWPEGHVGSREVMLAVGAATGLPDFILGEAPPVTREQVVEHFGASVAGQPEAVEAVADVVVAMQLGLCDPEKPLATWLFVGPTGVGKTETAKALAEYLFGSAARLVRFDMSEFASGASIARFVGWPGAPEGELTMALRTQPFCVVLLDEIEKAHPRVFDALLQLLGEGRLTDAAGRTADARQAVVVMTSNLGVREAAARVGFFKGHADEARAHYVAAARSFFRPEFFNRIDRVVPFRSLTPVALRAVLERALRGLLSRRGIRRGRVLVEVEPALLDLLVEEAYDPRYGARPLKRALERKLAVPLAHHLVRRGAEALTLVGLHRDGAELALSVRALVDAPRVDPAAPGDDDVLARLADVRARAEALRASPDAARLVEQRAAALAAMSRGAAPGAGGASVELLERLAAVEEALAALDERLAAGVALREESSRRWKTDMRDHERSHRDHNRYRGGLRPREAFTEVVLDPRDEAAQRLARPDVLALRDRLDVLAHQVAAAARGEAEVVTVLVEPLAGSDERWVVATALGAVALVGQDATLWTEREPGRWLATTADALAEHDARRAALTLRGPGVRALVAHLEGYAVLELQHEDDREAMLARVRVLDGEGLAAAARHDAAVAAARAAGPPDAEPGVVTLRLRRDTGRVVHVATGLEGEATEAVAAAVLRAARG